MIFILACTSSPPDSPPGAYSGPDSASAEEPFPTSRAAADWPYSTDSPWNIAPTWVWPASELSTAREDDYVGAVPTGQLVALPPGFDIEDQGWGEEGVAVARALQNYGAYVTDHASGFALYAGYGSRGGRMGGVRVEIDGPVTTVILDRTKVRNAIGRATAEALGARRFVGGAR